MWLKSPFVVLVIVVVLAIIYYTIEPWAVTFLDDGPYYSTEFSGPIAETPIQSQVELRRFGQLVYFLESRMLSANDESVLVLRNMEGSVEWTRLPVKPDGELGPIELRGARMTCPIHSAPIIGTDPEGFTVVIISVQDYENLKEQELFWARCDSGT